MAPLDIPETSLLKTPLNPRVYCSGDFRRKKVRQWGNGAVGSLAELASGHPSLPRYSILLVIKEKGERLKGKLGNGTDGLVILEGELGHQLVGLTRLQVQPGQVE